MVSIHKFKSATEINKRKVSHDQIYIFQKVFERNSLLEIYLSKVSWVNKYLKSRI
jgi:hypothetical protein